MYTRLGIYFSGMGIVDFAPPKITVLSILKLVKIYMWRNKRKHVTLINNSYSDNYLC